MRVEFTVPGRPVPQSRYKHFSNGGGKTNSDRVAAFKQMIQIYFPRGKFFKGKLRMEVIAYFKEPKKPKVRYDYPRVEADVDNVAKAVMDALNKLAYDDDSQVKTLVSDKEYVATEDQEKTVISIQELSNL